jgi:hypothetical protein
MHLLDIRLIRNMCLLKAVQVSILFAATATILATPAQAQMNENYAGGSASASTLGGLVGAVNGFTIGLDGRYKIEGSQFSARASLNRVAGAGVQATGTYDLAVTPTTNAYAGAGLSIANFVSPVLQVGAENKLGQRTVLYGGVDYLTRWNVVTAKVGFGYAFK